MTKIAIVGPESTGKSTLASQLAHHYRTGWVPEYAREYIDQLNRPYREEDLLIIARRQVEMEEAYSQKFPLLFCDTTLLVIRIWSEYKYGRCRAEIKDLMSDRSYDHYLLTHIDLPWEDDPQREHPEAREELFLLYHKALEGINKPFTLISGTGNQRLEKAIREVDLLLKHN